METDQDFDLQILKEKEGASRYRVNVIQSPAGEADGEFELPFSESEINELFRGLGQARKATRGAASPEVAKAREFGSQLFDRVFSGDIRDCLSNSRGRTQAAGAGLRIRLRLTKVPELLDLPWELFFDRRYNRFVALDDGMTLVRHLPVAEPVIPMRVEAPLRVLVAISNPRHDLDAEQEWTKLKDALADLIKRGLVEIERLQPATFDELGAKLRTGNFHVLHFVGHGEYDAATQSGFLLFELKPNREKRVGATRLADLLRPFRSLRLVVLNACEGGRASREDEFAGVAQSLVQSAMPAVVAMQFPVTDAAAIVFAGAFYAGLAAGRPVDLALADARREVNLKGEEGDIEWATPVLYMRGSGALFDVGEPTIPQVKKLPKKSRTPTAKRATPVKHSRHAIHAKEPAEAAESTVGTVNITWAPIARAGEWKPGETWPEFKLSNERLALFLDGRSVGDLDLAKGARFTVPPGFHTLRVRGSFSLDHYVRLGKLLQRGEPLPSPEPLPEAEVTFDLKGGETASFTVESVDTPGGQGRCAINLSSPVVRP